MFSFVPALEAQGVLPYGTVSLKSDLSEIKGCMVLLKYLIEGVLIKENARLYPEKYIVFCNHLNDHRALFRTSDMVLRIPEGMHYWIGADTKNSMLLKTKHIDRHRLDKSLVSLYDHSNLSEEQ